MWFLRLWTPIFFSFLARPFVLHPRLDGDGLALGSVEAPGLCEVNPDSRPGPLPTILRTTAFSLLVLTERPHPTRLFLKKSRTSLLCPVQSRSENALAARSLVRDPLADVGRATPELDTFSFGLSEKLHSVAVHQLYLREFDSDDTASVERSANDLQIFRNESTTHVKEQTLFSPTPVDSASHWLASPVVH